MIALSSYFFFYVPRFRTAVGAFSDLSFPSVAPSIACSPSPVFFVFKSPQVNPPAGALRCFPPLPVGLPFRTNPGESYWRFYGRSCLRSSYFLKGQSSTSAPPCCTRARFFVLTRHFGCSSRWSTQERKLTSATLSSIDLHLSLFGSGVALFLRALPYFPCLHQTSFGR